MLPRVKIWGKLLAEERRKSLGEHTRPRVWSLAPSPKTCVCDHSSFASDSTNCASASRKSNDPRWLSRGRRASRVRESGFRRGRRKRHARAHVLPLNAPPPLETLFIIHDARQYQLNKECLAQSRRGAKFLIKNLFSAFAALRLCAKIF